MIEPLTMLRSTLLLTLAFIASMETRGHNVQSHGRRLGRSLLDPATPPPPQQQQRAPCPVMVSYAANIGDVAQQLAPFFAGSMTVVESAVPAAEVSKIDEMWSKRVKNLSPPARSGPASSIDRLRHGSLGGGLRSES